MAKSTGPTPAIRRFRQPWRRRWRGFGACMTFGRSPTYISRQRYLKQNTRQANSQTPHLLDRTAKLFMLSHRQILRLFTTLIRFMRTGSQALGTLRLWREVIFLPMDYLNPNLPEAMLPISEPFLA